MEQPSENRPPAKQPWYRDGLQFECTQCGGCCSGEPGVVWVNHQEVQALAHAMAMDEEAFRDKFLRKVGARWSLVEYPDGDCIFLDPRTRGCIVYAARPVQCRTWPFWSSNVKTRKDWEQTCADCPGAGKGRLYSLSEIEAQRTKKRV